MASLATIRAANAAYKASYIPVAVFVGGTSGIGEATARAFAQSTKGEAHIVIVGRNKAAADATFATFPKSPNGRHEFVQCDLTLMRNVHLATSGLLSTLAKVNYLFMSAGFLTLKGRNETAEGIDTKLAVHYYSRWKFTFDLMPLLRKAKEAGEDAKVLTVLAAGHGGEIDLNDLGLKKTFTVARAAFTAPAYNDLMIESFSERYPDMAFTHMLPGAVRTGLFRSMHWTLKYVEPFILVLLYPIMISADTAGQYHLHALFEGDKGFFRRGYRANLLKNEGSGYFSTPEAKEKLWKHTLEQTTVVE